MRVGCLFARHRSSIYFSVLQKSAQCKTIPPLHPSVAHVIGQSLPHMRALRSTSDGDEQRVAERPDLVLDHEAELIGGWSRSNWNLRRGVVPDLAARVAYAFPIADVLGFAQVEHCLGSRVTNRACSSLAHRMAAPAVLDCYAFSAVAILSDLPLRQWVEA